MWCTGRRALTSRIGPLWHPLPVRKLPATSSWFCTDFGQERSASVRNGPAFALLTKIPSTYIRVWKNAESDTDFGSFSKMLASGSSARSQVFGMSGVRPPILCRYLAVKVADDFRPRFEPLLARCADGEVPRAIAEKQASHVAGKLSHFIV